jgi:hypothetical protein
MSFDRLVEEKIREAMARGEFDNLPGKGKPIDLSEYFATPEDLRLAYSLLKNAGFVPGEIQDLKDIEAMKLLLDSCGDEAEKKRLRRIIEERTVKFHMLLERRKR